jgi:general secretion pathway protein L
VAVDAINDGRRASKAILALADITHLLPDSAWLTQMTTDADTVHIQGFAQKASGLIEVFSKSRLFQDVRFAGPITKNGQLNAEQFDLSLRLH